MTFLGYFAGFGRGNIENLIRNIGVAAWLLLIAAIYILVRSIKHEYVHFKKDLPHKDNGDIN